MRAETRSCSGLQARSFDLILSDLKEIKQQTRSNLFLKVPSHKCKDPERKRTYLFGKLKVIEYKPGTLQCRHEFTF